MQVFNERVTWLHAMIKTLVVDDTGFRPISEFSYAVP